MECLHLLQHGIWKCIHMLCKVRKKYYFSKQNISSNVLQTIKHNKTFWYQFCNFKHFLKAENSEDSLASSCVELSIGLSCNPVRDWVTVGTTSTCMLALSGKKMTEGIEKPTKRCSGLSLVHGKYYQFSDFVSWIVRRRSTFIRDPAYFDSHTVFIKVCDTPHKTEFRCNTL